MYEPTAHKHVYHIRICANSKFSIHIPFFFFFFRLVPLSLRHFRRMSPSVLIRTRAVSDVKVAGSRVKTSVSLRRATCRGGHVEAVFEGSLHLQMRIWSGPDWKHIAQPFHMTIWRNNWRAKRNFALPRIPVCDYRCRTFITQPVECTEHFLVSTRQQVCCCFCFLSHG